MRKYYGFKKAEGAFIRSAVAIGMFDGVHLGHRYLIRQLVMQPKDLAKVIVTFDPPPCRVASGNGRKGRIMSLQHRLSILNGMGLDAAVIIPFTPEFAGTEPRDFITGALRAINTEKVLVGEDFRFGRDRSGDGTELRSMARDQGINVELIERLKLGQEDISSTKVRELVSKGAIHDAERFLARPVSVLGTVVEGRLKGRELGLPTANIDPHQEVIPPVGVYAVKVDIGDRFFDGVLNIGFKPTFFGEAEERRREPTVEVHLLDFKGRLYGKDIEIFFIEKLRDERRFSSELLLKESIHADISIARKVLSDRDVPAELERFFDMSLSENLL